MSGQWSIDIYTLNQWQSSAPPQLPLLLFTMCVHLYQKHEEGPCQWGLKTNNPWWFLITRLAPVSFTRVDAARCQRLLPLWMELCRSHASHHESKFTPNLHAYPLQPCYLKVSFSHNKCASNCTLRRPVVRAAWLSFELCLSDSFVSFS